MSKQKTSALNMTPEYRRELRALNQLERGAEKNIAQEQRRTMREINRLSKEFKKIRKGHEDILRRVRRRRAILAGRISS